MASEAGRNLGQSEARVWAPSARLLLALFGCVVLSFGAQWLLHGVYTFAIADWSQSWHFDAGVDWSAAQLFWQGGSPYTPEGLEFVGVGRRGFGHPPTTAFWFLPLAQLDEHAMAHMLGILNFGMLLALVALAVFSLRYPLPFITTLAIFGYVQDSRTTLDHNQIVQLSVVIAFGTVLAWKWLRDGADVRGGIALGLTCTLKPFPYLIVFLLLLSGRLRAVAAACVAFLAVAALMTWRFGLESWGLFLEQQKGIAKYWIDSIRNASLHGVLRRALRDRCASHPALDPRWVEWLTLGTCVLLLAFCTWVALRALRRARGKAAFDLAYALFCTLSVFINPWAWEHYLFVLILPLLIAAHALGSRFVQSFDAWCSGRVSHLRQFGASALIAAGALPLIQIPFWTHVSIHTNRLATRQYCDYHASAAVQAWMLRRAQFLELTSWLPWALTILLLAILLLLTPRQGEPEGGVSAMA